MKVLGLLVTTQMPVLRNALEKRSALLRAWRAIRKLSAIIIRDRIKDAPQSSLVSRGHVFGSFPTHVGGATNVFSNGHGDLHGIIAVDGRLRSRALDAAEQTADEGSANPWSRAPASSQRPPHRAAEVAATDIA